VKLGTVSLINETPPRGHPYASRVLVFEDAEAIRVALQSALGLAGHRVLLRDDGDHLETDLRTFKPDLVVLDVMLPGRDGFVLLDVVRGRPVCSPRPSSQPSCCPPPRLRSRRVAVGGPVGARIQVAPPDFDGGDRAGDYLWHDDSGFHLRVTHRGDRPDVFTGTIASPTPMRMAPARLEAPDRADLSPDGRTLWFSFTDYGHIDGVDFVTDCADHLDIGPLFDDGIPLPSTRVYLGANEIHPEHVPFGVARHEG